MHKVVLKASLASIGSLAASLLIVAVVVPMLGGSVVIETVFSIPGIGRLAQEAVAARDTPLLLGIILVSALMVIAINLAVDLVYTLLDPRIGSGEPA